MDSFFDFFESWRPDTGESAFQVEYKRYPYAAKIPLPAPKHLPINLGDAIKKRKTTRTFSTEPLTKQELSTLLYWSAGRIHRNSSQRESSLRRSFPSGGKRFAVELYLAVFKGKAIQTGLYHYEVETHRLAKISPFAEPVASALPYDFARKAPLLIVCSLITPRVTKKYGTLGYKLGILEAGHIAQNIYLVGASMDLATLAIGGTIGNLVDTAFNLSSSETTFYQIAIGHMDPNKESV